MAVIDSAKSALRISHSKLDAEIMRQIDVARAEMVRMGVPEARTQDDTDPLIVEAIVTYCQYVNNDDEKKSEGFYKSWECQVDGIRKQSWEAS